MGNHTTDYDLQAVAVAEIARQQELRAQVDTLMTVIWQAICNGTPDRIQARLFFGHILDQWREVGAAEAVGSRRKRKTIPRTLRQQVMERDAYRCVKCGDWHDLHLDHIIPVVCGGPDTADNLRVLCGECNNRKGAGL